MSVLLLEDDEGFRSALTELLEDDGHTVRAYRSIADVPPLAELPPCEVVITDYQLGRGEDGLSFAQRFHAAYPDVPIIVITAYASEYLIQAVAGMPYVSLLRKPLRYETLHALLHGDGDGSKS